MAFIDGSVVNVALPAMRTALKADAAQVQWIVNAYLLLLGALVLIGGSAGDRYGRRKVFVIGVVLFARRLAGLRPGPGRRLADRRPRRAGNRRGHAGRPAWRSWARPSTTHERGGAIGAWAGFGAVTTAIGPVLGGWLVDHVSWRAIFLINIPLAAATIWLALAAVRESRDPEVKHLDWRGAAWPPRAWAR
jgi:MFS family permease